MSRIQRLFGRINEAEIDDLDAGPSKLPFDLGEIPLETFFQPRELGPISGKANSKKADTECAHFTDP